ncbi:MAG TPA: PaaI family thioesterase [Acidimicrobiales bacterium]|nr:PaaI family thioesterase [Acidimicrobiales bacterium]
MPYPPAEHLLRDLGFEVETPPDGTATAWMPVTPAITDASGGVSLGVLATLVDSVSGNLAARTASPDRVATADLAVTVAGPCTGTEVEAAASVVRRGRTTLVVEVRLTDAAWATATFSILPRRDDTPGPVIPPIAPGRRAVLGGRGSALTRWIGDAIGITTVDASEGRLSVPLSAYTANSFGALQGGLVAFVAEQAGACALGRPAVELHVAYLSQCRDAPFTTSAELVGPDAAVVAVRDNAGRLATIANVAI